MGIEASYRRPPRRCYNGRMFYRVLLPPPGYRGFMVAEYRTLEYQSCTRSLFHTDGSRCFPTIEEALGALPSITVELPFERYAQFIRLFQAPDDPV